MTEPFSHTHRRPVSAAASRRAPAADVPTGAKVAPGEAEDTRSALIRAGIDLFGRNGFDGASTREIARAAGVNIAGIVYHFGSKAGLHRTCGEAIAAIVAEIVGPLAITPEILDDLEPDAAADLFVTTLMGIGRFMLGRPEAETIARFMVREQMDPTETFAVLYERLIRPRHEAMCRLFGRATGEDPRRADLIVAVSAMFGQIMFFRVGRATALARLGWATIDADRLDIILGVVTDQIRATIAARRAAASRETRS
ncbi:MAG: CerR family C-terminal domain-containing protein [Siculibacillus sp.]|nr:CerR family C-terminal domain-containing protein [Siculibacillus sp.]